jgi:hypothetical protein
MAKKKDSKKPPNKGNNQGKAVVQKKEHLPGAPNGTGEDERRVEFQEFCFDLVTKGWHQRDIAQALAKKFNLQIVPSHTTIAGFIRGAVTYRKESIADQRDAYLAIALPRLESIIREFLPIATNTVEGAQGPLYVKRVVKQFGMEVEVLDENAFAEQAKAAETIVKVTEQARKLLGIGINEKGEDEAKLTENRMQTLIFQAITNNISTGSNGHVKTVGPLPLTSGDKSIDEMEAGSL